MLLQHVYAARAHPARHGLVQNVSYILLLLSSRRDFAVALNTLVPGGAYAGLQLPAGGCTHADALVHVIFRRGHAPCVSLRSVSEPLYLTQRWYLSLQKAIFGPPPRSSPLLKSRN